MRPLVLVGLLLIVLGIAAFGYQGVLWVQGTQQVAQVGNVQINQQKDFPIPLAPIIGGLSVAAGVVMMIVGAPKRV